MDFQGLFRHAKGFTPLGASQLGQQGGCSLRAAAAAAAAAVAAGSVHQPLLHAVGSMNTTYAPCKGCGFQILSLKRIIGLPGHRSHDA